MAVTMKDGRNIVGVAALLALSVCAPAAQGTAIGDYEYWYSELPRPHLARFGRSPATETPTNRRAELPEPATDLRPPPLETASTPSPELTPPELTPPKLTSPELTSPPELTPATGTHIQHVPAHSSPTPPPSATNIQRVPPRHRPADVDAVQTPQDPSAEDVQASLPRLDAPERMESLQAAQSPPGASEAAVLPNPASLADAPRLKRGVGGATTSPLTVHEVVAADPKLALAAAAVDQLKRMEVREGSETVSSVDQTTNTTPVSSGDQTATTTPTASGDLDTANFFWGLGAVYPHLYHYRRIPHLVAVPGWNPYRHAGVRNPYQCC